MPVMAMMVTNAVLQAVNGIASRQSAAKQQAQQQEFQTALQRKQWEQSAELQREIQRINQIEAQRRQEETLAHQREMAQDQAFINKYPLDVLPHVVGETAKSYVDKGDSPPLYIITSISSSLNQTGIQLAPLVNNALMKVRSALGAHYGLNSDTPVQCYECKKEIGSQELTNIFSVFQGWPTIVLIPQCMDKQKFVLTCYYWGMGDVSKPCHVEILSCDVKKLQRSELCKIGMEWQQKKAQFNLPDNAAFDKLAKLVEEEKSVLAEKREMGATEEDIRKYIRPEFDKRYNDKDILSEAGPLVSEKMGEILDAASCVSVPLLADCFFLLAHEKTPKLLSVCQPEFKKFPDLVNVAQNIFHSLALNHENPIALPLMRARLALAYKDAGYIENASSEYDCGVNHLQKLVPAPANASWMLMPELKNGFEALKGLQPYLGKDDLKSFDKVISCPVKDLNLSAADEYKKGNISAACDIWRVAANKGDAKAAFNLAQVYEVREKNEHKASSFYKRAFDLGYYQNEKLLYAATQLTKQGNWYDAFSLWLHLLQTDEACSDKAAVISSLFILTTVADVASDEQKRVWKDSLHKKIASTRNLSLKNYALEYLGQAEQAGDRLALAILQGIAKRLWINESAPLIAGCKDGGDLTISAIELEPVKNYFMEYLNRG